MFFELFGAFFDVIEIFFYYVLKKPDEEDMSKNIRMLKKYGWFQELLQDGRARELIIHDWQVRQVIGKMNHKKFDRPFYQYRYEQKLRKILIKKLDSE
ncbi:hypothetical protein HNQ35_002506 [Cerasibacillus quisquiliarum]|nr:hypothetical protein [Cerasibacillus quisquiliarum]MBB5147288.1 hypothetical protein [Cerasibacillus quisquiliarum]